MWSVVFLNNVSFFRQTIWPWKILLQSYITVSRNTEVLIFSRQYWCGENYQARVILPNLLEKCKNQPRGSIHESKFYWNLSCKNLLRVQNFYLNKSIWWKIKKCLGKSVKTNLIDIPVQFNLNHVPVQSPPVRMKTSSSTFFASPAQSWWSRRSSQ